MSLRKILPFTLLVSALFILPTVTHAAIPFFGPIIPAEQATCAAGWGLLIVVINNIISLLLTLAILFFAPLMIAYAGFLYVMNPVSPEGRSKANKVLTNTVVGIAIALAGWMIVAAIMAVLYRPDAFGPAWYNIITSDGSSRCIDLKGVTP